MDAHGAEAGVIATRPWAASERQELVKNSRHPTVVQPPHHDDAQPVNWCPSRNGVFRPMPAFSLFAILGVA